MDTVSPEYRSRLEDLAESLMAKRRQQLGEQATQLVLFEVEE